jgi:tRNA(Ile)-lysidine synthase
LLDQVARTISRYRMLEAGQTIGIAVSGGADSVCLLHALRELAPRWNVRFCVLHLNHKLRGEESDGDAAFVRDLAAEFGFECRLREVDLAAASGNLEEAAREARLAFFGDEMRAGAADRVACGHTRSDQAETVLFRFLRGAGTAGLAGIRPVTGTGLIRPLIGVTREEVEQYLRERGLRWREDSTNRSLEFTRNRIRHQLLPSLVREWNPAMVRALAHTADWALAEEAYWEGELDRLVARFEAAGHLFVRNGFVLLHTGCLRELPLAVARRVVRRAMEQVKGDLAAIDFGHVNAVLYLAESTEGHGRIQPPGLDIMRSFDWLRFAKPSAVPGLETRNYTFAVAFPAVFPIPGENFSISLELIEKTADRKPYEFVYNGGMVWVDQERLSGALTLRNWRPGDKYQPFGSGGEQKIKSLFQEFRVPLWERRHWPVLTDGNSVVWARRFGAAVGVVARSESRRLLKIEEVGIGDGRLDVYKDDGAVTVESPAGRFREF